MRNDQIHEKFLCGRDRLFRYICRRFDDASQFGFAEKLFPNLTMIGGDGEQIGNASCFGIRMERDGRKPQTADNPDSARKIEPIL